MSGSRFVIAAGLAALALAGGHVGPLSLRTGTAAAACLILLAAAGGALPRGSAPAAGRRWRLLAAACGALGAWLVTVAPARESAALAAAVALAVVALALVARVRDDDGRAAAGPGPLYDVARAGLALSLFGLLLARSPGAWRLAYDATRAATEALGRWSGAGTSLGPSVAGLPVLVLLAAFLASRWQSAPAERPAIAAAGAWLGLIGVLGWSLGVPICLRVVGRLSGLSVLPAGAETPIPGYPASIAVYLPLALLLCGLAPILLLGIGCARGRAAATPAAPPAAPEGVGETARRGRASIAFPAAVAGAAAVCALIAAWPQLRFRPAGERPRVVLLDRSKLMDWRVPVVGTEGLERAGMFGLLPRVLEAAGYDVRRSKDALSADSLRDADVAVVINPTDPPSPEERARLGQFVERGGGLLVLGDHTDVVGIQEPLNQIVGPYGMRYEFDSAFTPNHWHDDAGFFPGPLTRGLDDADCVFQQSTGASLRLGRGAEAVATARWGFSDAGDRDNKDNAFLGDYIYQPKEPLGDLPVVATARAGAGRVIAFGDTSAFQNVAMPYAWPFILRVFATAASRPRPAAAAAAPWGLAALLLVGGWAAARGPARRHAAAAPAAALAGALLGLGLASLACAASEPQRLPLDARLAVIDAAHANDASLDLWDPRALSALAVNLGRSGYLAVIDRDGDPRLLDAASVYVSVAPRRAFDARELARVDRLLERGGQMVLAVGWEGKGPAGTLLRRARLDIDAVPLGPVPVLRKISDPEIYVRLQMDPHFASAWPIAGAAPAGDEILYAAEGSPIVLRRTIGRGRLTLIADSLFLLNRTLEEEGTSWQGNVAFLRRVFEPADAALRAAGAGR